MSNLSGDSRLRPRRLRWSLRTLLLVIGALAMVFGVVIPSYRPRPRFWEDPRVRGIVANCDTIEVFVLDPAAPKVTNKGDIVRSKYAVAKGPIELAETDRIKMRSLLVAPATFVPGAHQIGGDYDYRVRVRSDDDTLDLYIALRETRVLATANDFPWHVEELTKAGQDSIVAVIKVAFATPTK